MTVVRKTNCQLCGYLCGVEVVLDERDRIIKIQPDPSRYPYDSTVMGGCRRFAANKEILDHPDRINYPLKRKGRRGSGEWERVSWDQAIDEIAVRLEDGKSRYGAESLATCIGAPHTMYWPMHRFLNVWGTPNNAGIGIVCWNPRIWVNSLTFGWPIDDDLQPDQTECVLLWGINPAESDHSLFWKMLKDYSQTDGDMIVIDPIRTATAELADRWISIRPGTDGALALGLLNIIIAEKLYDAAFLRKWCAGFDALAERVRDYPPERVSKITGVSEDSLFDLAGRYAKAKPAAIFTGLGIDHSGINCTQTLRAIAILKAICGNIDTPGGSFLNEKSDFVPEVDLELGHLLSQDQKEKKLGKYYFILQRYEGYEKLTQFTLKHGKKLPTRYMTSAHPALLWRAMITGQPYPVRSLICMASNPLLSQADTQTVYKAMTSLDLSVTLEHFMTPTAMLSDYVLPITGSFEQSAVQINGGVANIAYGGGSAVKSRYERRPDFDFWSDLGRRCGQGKYWPWKTQEEALDEIFSPTGQTWETFCQTGLYAPEPVYRKHEKNGFATPTGKIELFSKVLADLGYDGLPAFQDDPSLKRNRTLTLITGARKHPYYSSQFRQIKKIRKRHPYPLAEISSETAESLGLLEGDDVWIATDQGRIRHRLAFKTMQPGVISIEYGWWFPEKPAKTPELGGLWESNANILTTADPNKCDPILGQWNFRSLPCRVYKAFDSSKIKVFRARPEHYDAFTELLYENGMDAAGSANEYIVAMYEDEIAGCVRIKDADATVMIRPLLVAKKYRGNHIGRILLESVMPKDRPTALVARGGATEFYESLGFEDTLWAFIPKEYQNECFNCRDHHLCKPRPMIFDPAENHSQRAVGDNR